MGKAKVAKLEVRQLNEPRIEVPAATLDEIESLYDQGRYVDACQVALKTGPLKQWTGGRAQVLGSRLAHNVGAARLGALLIHRAVRIQPVCHEACVQFAYLLEYQHGPLAAWRYCLQKEALPGLEPTILADLKARRATVAALYHDFATAWPLWEEAVSLTGPSAWLCIERTNILQAEEKREEALASLDEALALRPWFRPAVQWRARFLHMQGRLDEAVSYLEEAVTRLQSCSIAAQLATLKRELDDPAGMLAAIDRFEQCATLAEEPEKLWASAGRQHAYIISQRFGEAASLAEGLPGEYQQALAKRLRVPGVTHEMKRLKVDFVHQTQNTCAPATLAALTQFWGRSISMEQIADLICYDGTYDHRERGWALENGFAVREFKVTLPAVRQLIDRGMPFDLTTVEVESAHAQAVIGYDLLKQTLFLQDPSEPHYRELDAEEFLQQYQLTGPRGLVMVPQERAAELDSLDLPEAALYDLSHRFNKALASYDVASAAEALAALKAQAPEHRLTLLAELSQANFDGHEVERLKCIDRLLIMFPDDPRVVNWKYVALGSLGRRDDRLRLLRDAISQEDSHPAFRRRLVEELMEDARDWSEARRLVWQAHRRQGVESRMVIALAEVLRRTQTAEPEEWLTYFRFATALGMLVESYARTWFSLAQSQGRGEEALAWLQQRYQALGSKSGQPAITYALALDALGRPEMLDVLRAALAQLPEDGDLLLESARLEARVGDAAHAFALLERARSHAAPAAWRRAGIFIRQILGDHAGAMALWQEILVAEPLAMDAHRAFVADLAVSRGQDAVLLHLQQMHERFPSHQGLAQLRLSWLREFGSSEAFTFAHHLTQLHSTESWSWFELASIYVDFGRMEDAQAPAQQAVLLSPDSPLAHALLGAVNQRLGHLKEAEAACQKAIALDVNHDAAFGVLVSLRQETTAKRQVLAFIRAEMVRQVLNGNALHTYRELAFPILSAAELLVELREIHQARPDLWEAWSVLISQLLDMERRDEAMSLAQQASLRFALVPGAWRDMARCWRAVDKPEAAIQCGRHVVRLNPGWISGWELLAEHLEDHGQPEEAAAVLRKAVHQLPLEYSLHGRLGLLLWRMDQRQEAWDICEKVARRDPGQVWAWNVLKEWAYLLQKQDALIALGQELTRLRPDEARSWEIYSTLLPQERLPELLAANEQALKLNPKLVSAYDFRIEMLALLGRVAEAETVLKNTPWSEADMPPTLLGRQAWLRYQSGQKLEAMRSMRAVLERHRDYLWGWDIYSQWAEESTNLTEWKHALDELRRLTPQNAEVYCALADHALRVNNRAQAIAYHEQALALDPGSPRAASSLLSLHWQKRDLAAIAKITAALPDIGTAALIKRVYTMFVAAEKGNTEQVRADLQWLATQPDGLGPMLEDIWAYFRSRKSQPLFDGVLQQVIEADTISPAFATLWIQKEVAAQRWACWQNLAQWLPRLGSRLDSALMHYLNAIADARVAKLPVSSLVAACGPELRKRTLVWGQVGYAFVSSQCYREAVDWQLPDYKRPDVPCWALWNLIYALRMLLKPDEAAEVSFYAIEIGARDPSIWPNIVAIAAFAQASRQDYGAAQELLASESGEDPTWTDGKVLRRAARAASAIMRMPAAEARPVFKKFVADVRGIVRNQGVTVQTQRDYESMLQRLQGHVGVRLMPWEKVQLKQAASAQQSSSSRSRIPIFVAIVIGIQLLRACASLDSPSRRSMPSEMDKMIRQLQESPTTKRSQSAPNQPGIQLQPSLPPASGSIPGFPEIR